MTHCGAFQPVLFCDHLPCRAHPGCQAGNAPERGFLSRLFTGASRALQNGRLTQPVVVEPCHTQFTVLDYLLSQEVSLDVTLWLGSTRVARTLWHLHSVLEYASFKSGFFYNSPLLLIVDSNVSNTEMSWWVIFQFNSTVFLNLGCRIPWLAALASVQGDVSLAVSTNLNSNNVTAVEIKMMFHSS